MKVLAINGSPRKQWNTASLLGKALEGAASQGAETELIHLYDLDYKGCLSCFACKRKGGESYGKCAVQDGLTPVLEKAAAADAFVLGSPIYLGWVTGMTQAMIERLTFPYLVYDGKYSSLFPKQIRTGFIYTFGAPEDRMRVAKMDQAPKRHEGIMGRIFGACEVLLVTDTYQFDDYSKYEASGHDPVAKAKRREEVWPQDLQKAFEVGVRLGQG